MSILIYSILYFYIVEQYIKKAKIVQYYIILFPVIIAFSIIPSIQLGIGTDYYTYLNYYDRDVSLFFRKKEYVFYFIYEIIAYWKLGAQSFFLFTTIINAFLFFLTLFLLNKLGYKGYLIFFIWFVVTGYYNNQMNIIRQFIPIYSLPLLFLLFLYKQKFKFIIVFFLALFSHASFIFVFTAMMVLLFLRKIATRKKLIYIFFFSILVYNNILPSSIDFIVNQYFPLYAHYLDSSITDGVGLKGILTKIYYLPAFLLFIYIYKKYDSFYLKYIEKDIFFDVFILIWAFTTFMYLLVFYYGFFGRIYIYFAFFNIFPLYYIFVYLYKYRYIKLLLFYIGYLLLPYLIKVLVFPIKEYNFTTIIN